MEWAFNKVGSLKVTQEIVEQITGLVMEGKLEPGEKLPSERALAVLLGVGRSSLREALNTLEARGLVEIRKRQGIYVQNVSSPRMLDPLRHLLDDNPSRILELLDLRRDLEMASAAQAARRRQTGDVERLWQCFEVMKASQENPDQTMDLDRELHLGIAMASKNFLRVHMLRSFFDLSREIVGQAVEHFCRDTDHQATVLGQHQSLVEAIADGDPTRARRRMDEHLTWVAYTWQEVGT